MAQGAEFWDRRYEGDTFAYGVQPNAFVAEAAERWLPEAGETPSVLDLGSGEGRNTVFLAAQACRVTAVDFSAAGLRKTTALAAEHGVEVETRQVDVRTWEPGQTWDAVVTTFLHLEERTRPRLYRLLQSVVRPGGLVVGEWFRPEQRVDGYDSGGPPRVDMMVDAVELRAHFPESGLRHLAAAYPVLDEGSHHQGPAATIRLVWQKAEEE